MTIYDEIDGLSDQLDEMPTKDVVDIAEYFAKNLNPHTFKLFVKALNDVEI